MCQIIVAPAGKKIDMSKLDKAQKHNEDGYGVSWYENNKVNTYKTMNYNTFKGIISALKPYSKIVHLRYATVGLVNSNNCHPFDIPTGVMFHNGTINSLSPDKKYNPTTFKYEVSSSDSRELGILLNKVDYDSIEGITPLLKHIIGDKINKLAFMEDNGTITIVNEQLGMTEDGIWYSNDYHKKSAAWCRYGCSTTTTKTHKKETKVITKQQLVAKASKENSKESLTKVFVYGTLKRGYGNHSYHLSDAIYLGKASTKEKWTMIGEGMGFPYVVEEHPLLGHNVKGEVYNVTKSQLRKLDQLEGVSSYHYKKVPITVKFNDDKMAMDKVTMYIACYKPQGYTGAKKLEEWTR